MKYNRKMGDGMTKKEAGPQQKDQRGERTQGIKHTKRCKWSKREDIKKQGKKVMKDGEGAS
jgi:hypothetical protein